MKTVLCFIFTALLTFPSFSQKNVDPSESEIETATALKEKYPEDHVAVEFSKEYVSFAIDKRNKKLTVDHSVKEGMINLDSRADIQKYCFYDGESKVTEFNVQYKNKKDVYLKINDDAYTSNDLFHNDTRVKYTNLNFPLKGYKYLTYISKRYKDVKYFTSLYFKDQYPIVKKIIEIEIPNWLDLELREINFEGFDIQKSVKNNAKGNSKIYSYTIENMPATNKENNAPGPTHIYPHILILAKSYTSNNEKIVIFNSTQDLYNWYKSLVGSLKNNESSFKETVDELTKSAATDEEKVKNIYYWVQDNIRYIAFEDGIAGFKPDEASNVYNKKYGDCKGMANLTKQMLIEAGFDARLTWIGTKRIAYDYSTPNLSIDNHMICTVLINGDTIFLDGTEKFIPYGECADRIQGKQVMIENGDSFILKEVPVTDMTFNEENYNYNLVLEGEEIVGNASKNFNGESRTSILSYFNTLKTDKKEEFLERYLENGNSNIKVSNIETSDLLDRELSLKLSYDIAIKNGVSSFDNDYYIAIDIDKELSNFAMKERKTDYIFSYKRDIKSTTSLKYPSGYEITHLPKNISISSKNYDLSVDFSEHENTITYTKQFSIKNAKIEIADLEEWNGFIEKLNDVYNDQIIITKQ